MGARRQRMGSAVRATKASVSLRARYSVWSDLPSHPGGQLLTLLIWISRSRIKLDDGTLLDG
jgi:hypothetical protein